MTLRQLIKEENNRVKSILKEGDISVQDYTGSLDTPTQSGSKRSFEVGDVVRWVYIPKSIVRLDNGRIDTKKGKPRKLKGTIIAFMGGEKVPGLLVAKVQVRNKAYYPLVKKLTLVKPASENDDKEKGNEMLEKLKGHISNYMDQNHSYGKDDDTYGFEEGGEDQF